MKKISLATLMFSLALSCRVEAAEIYVSQIEVDGLQRVERETVLSYLNVEQGSSVSQEYLNSSMKRLFETGLFADVNIDARGNGVLAVKVVENPVINKRVFDGNDKVDDTLLESEVQLKSGSIYNIAKVQDDVQRILEVYKRSGRYATVVEPKIIKRDQNRVDLVYEISEGPTAAISKVNFIGNHHYSDDDLQSEIMSKESRWYRLFSSSEKVLRVDKERSRASTSETDSSGGTRQQADESLRESTVLAGSSGSGEPVVEKELAPEISGIVISAQGGGNASVQKEISEAMQALFGLPAHKIKVLKRVE